MQRKLVFRFKTGWQWCSISAWNCNGTSHETWLVWKDLALSTWYPGLEDATEYRQFLALTQHHNLCHLQNSLDRIWILG